jgi:hypothetical protein
LLREDLEEKDIPHCTAMTDRILELHQEQTEQLSSQMQVCLSTLLLYYTDFNLEKLHGKDFLYHGHLDGLQHEILYGSYCPLATASFTAAVKD